MKNLCELICTEPERLDFCLDLKQKNGKEYKLMDKLEAKIIFRDSVSRFGVKNNGLFLPT